MAFGSASRRSIQLSYGSKNAVSPMLPWLTSAFRVTRRCFRIRPKSDEHRLLYHENREEGKGSLAIITVACEQFCRSHRDAVPASADAYLTYQRFVHLAFQGSRR